jgi:uncharacterized protein YndB with AHSA1/START domain
VIQPIPETGVLRFIRVFDAPRELVFRCMIEPEHLAYFWGPTGVSTPLEDIVVEPRPGGRFETVMVNDCDGSRYPTRAVYVEVSEPERLVWRELDTGMTVTSTFVELDGDRCEVQIVQTNVPAGFSLPEMQVGFRTSLDRFAAHLQTLIAGSGS